MQGINDNDTYALYDEDKNYISGGNIKNNTAINMTNARFIRFSIKNTVDLNKIKVEEGSILTPYSPYGMGSHKINMVNKNFYNKNIQYEIGQGYSNDGIWGNYNGGWASNRYEDIPIEENCTFTLVGNIVPTSYTTKFFYFDIYGKLIKYEEKKLNSGKIIFTTPVNTKYLSFQVFNGTTNKLNQETIQIEKGSFSTEIVYYEGKSYVILTQQPMRAVGNVRDCFVIKEDGKRYERHNIARIESYNGEVINTEYMSTTGELSTGATVDYLLETPNDLLCTEQQNQILDKLDNIRTYKNVTHIFSNDEVGANVNIGYRKDIETLINNTQSMILADEEVV